MIRLYVVILQLFIAFFSGLLNSDVTMKMEAPGQMNAGNDLKIQINLDKGSVNGFSRFQLELPAGITASAANSANADFTFKDKKVRLIWLKLPDASTLSFSFVLHCDERLKGSFDITGKFSFIDNNERKSVDVPAQSVAIIPSTTIDPSLIVDIKEFGKASPSIAGTSSSDIACIRQKPEWSAINNEYVVTLLVNKESLKKFAKIEEAVPAGYTALNIDSKEGIFTFKDNKAKFLWMNLPAEPYFTVSYKLIPMNTASVQKMAPVLKGNFSFINDDKTLSVPILEKEADLANLTPEAVKNILHAPVYVAATNTVAKNTKTETIPVAEKVKPVDKQVVAITTVPALDNKTKQLTATTQETNNSTSVSQEIGNQLTPLSGLLFRIQVAAGHKPINIKSYFRKYKLDNSVYKESHNGWIKYSVGSFVAYKDARDYRTHIWNTTAIPDAFVAAYNDNKRITVQEALMITNQKWVQ